MTDDSPAGVVLSMNEIEDPSTLSCCGLSLFKSNKQYRLVIKRNVSITEAVV